MVKKNILVVEDNMIIAIDIQQKLHQFGYNVSAIAQSGEQAITKTVALKPDLVIMDIGLKGIMNGIETGKKIKEDFNIPVIYLTGNSNLLKQANVKDPWLDKPFNNGELKKLINKVLSSHTS